MKIFFKKILSFALLLIASMPVVFTLFFLLKQQAIRYVMKEKLENQILHTITMPAKDIVWMKYNKEISYQGKMFDIKSITVSNGQYIIAGLFDNEETDLNKLLEKETDKKDNPDNNLLAQFFHLLQSACTEHGDDVLPETLQPKNLSILILPDISSPFKDILTPPPQA